MVTFQLVKIKDKTVLYSYFKNKKTLQIPEVFENYFDKYYLLVLPLSFALAS
jgi:hypothetical protein